MRRNSLAVWTFAIITVLAIGCGDSTGPERPGTPTNLEVSAGDGQTGIVTSVLAGPLAAKVTDAKGRGVPGVEVGFQAMPGSGTVAPTSARTNAAGVALTAWTLPTVVVTGATVRAVLVNPSTGVLVDSVSFRATVVGGSPVTMYATSSPYQGATGSTVGPLSVTLYDRYGNPSPGARVTWTVTAGGGTVSAPTTLSDTSGVASVSLTLGTAPGPNVVRAFVGTMAATFSIEAKVAGRAESISVSPYPSIASVSDVLPLQVVVKDGLAQPVVGGTVSWTVLDGGGLLSSATSTTDGAGVATIQYTMGSETVPNVIEAKIGSLTATFRIEGRTITRHLAYFGSNAYGIDRTSSGRFVVSLINGEAVVTFQQSSPETKQTITTGGTPVIVAVDDAGALAYVSNMSGWMDIISLTTNSIVKRVPVPSAHSLALSPAGDRVYVASSAGSVYAISTTTRQIVNSVAVPNGPWGFAFKTNPTDSLMYVTSRDGGSVTEVDMKTMAVLRTFNIGGRPHGLTISPDGRTLYAADIAEGKVKAIDVTSGTVTAFVALEGAFGIAISPDGTTLYVTAGGGKVAVLTAASLAITKTLDTNGSPRQVVIAPDGATAFSANEGGWVDIIPR
jgi:YVTN family beta-propeller protein